MAGSTAPIKNFDPLSYSTIGSDETLAWFRAAELKHSRVAMLATSGDAYYLYLPAYKRVRRVVGQSRGERFFDTDFLRDDGR